MAFKTFDTYLADKNKDFFILPNDKDYADVIFLYRSTHDVLVADAHYIKSADYSGYVHCCGKGCPACAKGIRVQTKIFIPLFNYKTDKIEFWDRSNYFERQLMNDVLSRYPNPSEWVFRVTREGAAGDQNTRYTIAAQGKNSRNPYEKILADNGITLPQGYEAACKDFTSSELEYMLNAASATPTSEYNYIPTPRASSNTYEPPSDFIPEPVSVAPPVFEEDFSEPEPAPSIPFNADAIQPAVAEPVSDDLSDVNF